MRFHRPRLTIRFLMSLTLIVALLLGGGMWGGRLIKRGAYYRQIARQQATLEQGYRELIPTLERSLSFEQEMASRLARWAGWHADPDPWFGNEEHRKRNLAISLHRVRRTEWQIGVYVRRIEHLRAVADHHASLRTKYEHAATHPWKTVPPDQPEPPAPADPPEPKMAPSVPPADPRRQLPPSRILTILVRTLDPCLRS
jgi:hypothetical protein